METKDQIEVPLNSEAPLGEIHPDGGNSSDDNNSKPADKKEKNADEVFRLAGRTPLKTLLVLALGPLISQLVSALYGVVASMWVAKAMGDLGMAAVSLFTNLDNVGRAFGFFMNCAASQKISSLFGEKKGDEAGQVVCDLFRCCFLCGIVVPAILIPPAKPIGKWFGADEITNQMGVNYLAVLLGCSTISCIFLMFCGVLQAEGRTMLVSISQIASLVLNMALFCPLFLLVFKLGTIGASLATVCSELIISIILFILFFAGKFGVKPKLSGLVKKFSPHTWPALSVGVSQLAANTSRSLPSILQRKFMGMATRDPIAANMSFNDAMSGFTAVIRTYGITDSVRLAISMSLLPTASYAYSAKLYSRFFHLIGHSCWLNLVWGVSTCLVTTFAPKYVAMLISSSPSYLKAAAPMLSTSNMDAPFGWGRFVCQTILQALSCGALATGYSLVATFFMNIAAYCLMYYTDTHNVPRQMWSYSVSSGAAFVLGVLILIRPIKKVIESAKAEKLQTVDSVEDDDGSNSKDLEVEHLSEDGNEKAAKTEEI